jgi:hypothetical protein
MDEKNIEENKTINGENQQELQQDLFINLQKNNNEEINEKEMNSNDNNLNLNEEIEEENNIKNQEIIDSKKDQVPTFIENNNINNNDNINNMNIINTNSNLLFQMSNPLQKRINNLNSDKNLSREEREEQTENSLRNLLTELSNIKQQGNDYVKNNNFEQAEKKYEEGINKINKFITTSNIEEINGQIQDHLMNMNLINIQLYNNLSTVLYKQKKYKECLKNSEYIIQALNQDHIASYGRILYCLIELKKVILANHYADIIKKKFGNGDSFSKFKDQFNKLEIINKEFSDQILNKNPELKKEIISINNNIKIKNEVKEEEPENKVKKYMPYIIGGFAFLLIAGRYIYKKCKEK